ncbi:hypothetical protein Igag_1486 [Ignisphaera aggregans DSM 17230]|uniref:Uncharacterized protein n=1 Tax=Ignisphaera aggregans (strain DSM 17230 / JCM 13409 / AQ1.S1) TaxID=583356 RepID=E0SQV8_IGNAA|nr:hypothetical protein Igag_1486 [Ignisphaera aggregans DSM 17230]
MSIDRFTLILIISLISSIYTILQYLFISSSIDKIINLIIWCIAVGLAYLTYLLYLCSNCRELKIILLPRISNLHKILERFLVFSIELLTISFFVENIFIKIIGRNFTTIAISSLMIIIIWFLMQRLLSRNIRLLIEIVLIIITYIYTPSLTHEMKGLEEQFKLIEVIFNAIG